MIHIGTVVLWASVAAVVGFFVGCFVGSRMAKRNSVYHGEFYYGGKYYYCEQEGKGL